MLLAAAGFVVRTSRGFIVLWASALLIHLLPTMGLCLWNRQRVASPQCRRFVGLALFADATLVAYATACLLAVNPLGVAPAAVAAAAKPVSAIIVVAAMGAWILTFAYPISWRSGQRAALVDYVDLLVIVLATAGPLALPVIGPVWHAQQSWFGLGLLLSAITIPVLVAVTAVSFAQLPPGQRASVGGNFVVATLAGVATWIGVGETISGVTVLAVPVVALLCLTTGSGLIMAAWLPDEDPAGLERLAPQAQIRRRFPIPVLLPVVVPVIIIETVVMSSRHGWVVPYSFILLSTLVVLVAEQRLLGERETRGLYGEVERASEDRQRLLANLVRAVEDDRYCVVAQLHEQGIRLLVDDRRHGEGDVERVAREYAGALTAALADMQADAAARVETFRQLMVAMRPPVLAEQSLASAIRAYANELLEQAACHLTVTIGPGLEFDWTTKTIIYRIATEALDNIKRHAHASHGTVTITETDGAVSVEVGDDGRGMGPVTEAPGAGISRMRLFAGLAAGSLEVSSGSGSGTLVRAVLGGSLPRIADRPSVPEPLHLIVGSRGSDPAG